MVQETNGTTDQRSSWISGKKKIIAAILGIIVTAALIYFPTQTGQINTWNTVILDALPFILSLAYIVVEGSVDKSRASAAVQATVTDPEVIASVLKVASELAQARKTPATAATPITSGQVIQAQAPVVATPRPCRQHRYRR